LPYIQRDIANMEAAFGRQISQLTDPAYLPAFAIGAMGLYESQLTTQLENPTRPALTAGNLVPGFSAGNPDRANWAGGRGQEIPVTFTATDGASLRGDVFAPLPGARDPYTNQPIHGPYPGAVIVPGSIQGTRDEYAWLAEDLAERGYVVLTFDVQGQGGSETLPHEGPDPNLPACDLTTIGPGQDTPCDGVPSEQDQDFVDSTEAAITFFLSTPAAPYPNVHAGNLAVNDYNPLWALFDHSPDTETVTPGRTTRLALIGHSTGAVIATYLQGVDPRIETLVALDKLTATPDSISDDQAETGSLPGPVVPKVPALALQAEYGFAPQPYFEASCSSFEPCPASPEHQLAVNLNQAPDPNREEDTGFNVWRKAGIDSMIIVPRASTHLNFTDSPPVLPASLTGSAMISYYTQAWLAKYLKHDPNAGYELLSPTIHYIGPSQTTGQWVEQTINRDDNLSFYFCSGYQFNLGGGKTFADPDIIHDGCH
jgi:pimeloyl-ACP methyl ester carboxylesterase